MAENSYAELLETVRSVDWERVYEMASQLTRQFAPLDLLARSCIQEYLHQSADDPNLSGSGTPPWASRLLMYSTPFLVLSSRLDEFHAVCTEPFADDDDCELAAVGPTC